MLQLTQQQQQVIMSLQQELQYRQRQAQEIQEKIALVLGTLGVQRIEIQLSALEASDVPPTPPTQ